MITFFFDKLLLFVEVVGSAFDWHFYATNLLNKFLTCFDLEYLFLK